MPQKPKHPSLWMLGSGWCTCMSKSHTYTCALDFFINNQTFNELSNVSLPLFLFFFFTLAANPRVCAKSVGGRCGFRKAQTMTVTSTLFFHFVELFTSLETLFTQLDGFFHGFCFFSRYVFVVFVEISLSHFQQVRCILFVLLHLPL